MSIDSLKFGNHPKRHPKLFWGALLGVGGFLYLKVWLPVTNIAIPCVFHEVTGLYCPGCGITRAALSLLRLDFVQAFRYNPLVFILLPLYVIYFIAKKKQMRLVSNGIMTIMLILTLAFGLLRNIPMFDWLAPTEIRS
ncbi:DUF2752 domain-containing protein [Paenibacillus eucommiae]|uniref:DUF2752 domain-containing protein n=1 Tax=Paenibacillus eucommiae TaxID=1355755 RepID=UPI001AE9472A|nr:DUF2752 domain-containing protein [Paenibacillus eucommiae]